MFCQKCGAILKPKKVKGKNVMSCSCGFNSKDAEIELKETLEQEKELEVVDETQAEESLPITTDEACPECGNIEARYWLVQTRAGDEPETQFLKCTKCKNTWRKY